MLAWEIIFYPDVGESLFVLSSKSGTVLPLPLKLVSHRELMLVPV